METVDDLRKELYKKADRKKAELLQRFFKTGKGEYGEGDLFLGITVPDSRKIAVKFREIDFTGLALLISGKFHEERLIALLILVLKFEKADAPGQKKIYDFYIKNKKYINNWDLVDLTAPKIVGAYLEDKDRGLLYTFARSKNIWDRRIAMLSCFHYICKGDCRDAMKIAEILKNDKHDLIQKAVGWMLRESGKRCSRKTEEEFLEKNCRTMPRTMLRYAIEKFPQKTRQFYLNK